MIHLHGIVVTFFLLTLESLSAEESTRWVYIAKTEVIKTLFSTWNHMKNIVFNMKSYHNRGLFRTFPLLPCIQCSSLSKKQGEAMMLIEPILILDDLCWFQSFRYPESSSNIKLLSPTLWDQVNHLDHKCRSSNHHYNCFYILLKYWFQLCPLLLQPDPLLHDQPRPAVELVHAQTHKTTTGQDDAHRGGNGGCDNYDDVEVITLLWNLFSPQNKHQS